MHRIICICALFLLCLPSEGQLTRDAEAAKILDRLSARSKSDYPVQIAFEYVYESLIEKETVKETGSLVLDGDKFRLKIGEADVYCDGMTMWNHLSMAGEVYISDAEDSQGQDEFFISAPGNLFTFYQEGFKYELKGELEYQGNKYYSIYLYPENPEKNYHTIKLLISTDNLYLYSAEAIGKHGVNHSVIIKEYRRKVKTDDNNFVFDTNKFPDLEIIDTRF